VKQGKADKVSGRNVDVTIGVTSSLRRVTASLMGVFDSKAAQHSTPLNNRLRKNPLLFGVPFVMIMVVASYALVPFAQTKYELQDRKVSKVRLTVRTFATAETPSFDTLFYQVTKEQELGLENRKRKFDIREEYFASVFFQTPPSGSLRLTFRLPPETQREGYLMTGSPSASSGQPEHLSGACPPPEPSSKAAVTLPEYTIQGSGV
jgi:cytochrome c oxidase assembly protein subunit 16